VVMRGCRESVFTRGGCGVYERCVLRVQESFRPPLGFYMGSHDLCMRCLTMRSLTTLPNASSEGTVVR
jgi:hypothetical protein